MIHNDTPWGFKSADRILVHPGPSKLGDSEDGGTRHEGLTERETHRTALHRRNATAPGRWLQYEVSFGSCICAPTHPFQMRIHVKRETASCLGCLRSCRTKQTVCVSGTIRFAHGRTEKASTG